MKTVNLLCRFFLRIPAFLCILAFLFIPQSETFALTSYTRDAVLKDGTGYPGVYYVQVSKDDVTVSNAEIGIPSIAKQNLERPTTESPAIIMGAAVPYETRTGYTTFTKKAGGALYPPYSYFRYSMIEEQNHNTSGTHLKMSGFDGSYVIIRVDVSDLVEGASEDSVLHVKHEGNKALSVIMGPGGTEEAPTFSDGRGTKTASYPLRNNAAALKDTTGSDQGKPYVDVIVMSSGTIVQGADTGSAAPGQFSADFSLKFYVDTTLDYNPDLKYDPASYNPTDPNAPTLESLMLKKYYDEEQMPDGTAVSAYTIKGGDLELEIMNDDESRGTAPEFWSLRQAMAWDEYYDSPVRLICEVPVLEGILVDGGRHVILDVNSFDIQIANHQSTGAAALTVRNAQLTLKDGLGTTGAELAVGNNATMAIESGGVLIIDQSCQLEVEYDAASTAPGQEQPDLNNGILTIYDGGQIINNGVITVEGTEGKPIDPAAPTQRDVKNAEFHILPGGKLTNNGCLLSNGVFFNMGTIENYGHYNSEISSNDPDKGKYTYHRGIQVSWKDDVTQASTYMGNFSHGKDADGTTNPSASLINEGDIVLVPGYLEAWGAVENRNGGAIYVCAVDEAVIPIQPAVDDPYTTEERIRFGEPMKSYISVEPGGSLRNDGTIAAAKVEVRNNGRTGNLTEIGEDSALITDLRLKNLGETINGGAICLDGVDTFETMTNTGSVSGKIILSANTTQQNSIVYDRADKKLTEVYNAEKTVEGNTNIWRYAGGKAITVKPGTQTKRGGETPAWTVGAEAESGAAGILYIVKVFKPTETKPCMDFAVETGKETAVTGPVLPEMNGNLLFRFYIDDGTMGAYTTASVKVSSDAVDPPAGIDGLVYNGTAQKLVTEGFANSGILEYRLGENGAWGTDVPSATNAGTYTVYYRVAETAGADTGEEGAFEVSIAQRELIISADDIAGPGTPDPADLSFTVSGLADGDSLANSSSISLSAEPDAADPARWIITPDISGVQADNPNYKITSRTGTCAQTQGIRVIAKDKYGTFSDDITYKGFNIQLNVNGTDVGATVLADAGVWFSTTQELTKDNYQTAGFTPDQLPDYPAGAGIHQVWYYVCSPDGSDPVYGSRYVIIDKAQQKAPENLTGREESFRNSGDGRISGLVPRTMEYRKMGSGRYETAYYEEITVASGTWMVRKAADRNHYASPDSEVVVSPGPFITISFDSDGGSAVPDIEGLSVGDVPERPEDPVYEGHQFLGWFFRDEEYSFDTPVEISMLLTARWKEQAPAPAHVHELLLVGAKEASCTEKGNMIYYSCSLCGLWFEDATALIEIKDHSSVLIPALGHEWDAGRVTKEPSETQPGIRTYTCLRDGSHTKTEEIPPLGHTHVLREMPAAEPGCTEPGNTACFICEGCGLWFRDAEGKIQITDRNSVVIPATGHRWDAGIVTKEPTRTEDGVRTYTCLNDPAHTKTESIPAKGSSSGGSSSGGGNTGSRVLRRGSSGGGSNTWFHDETGWHFREGGALVKDSWRFLSWNGLSFWYFFDADGVMVTGWLDRGGKRYYLYPVSDGWMGRMLTGWQMIEGKWYYFDNDGALNEERGEER